MDSCYASVFLMLFGAFIVWKKSRVNMFSNISFSVQRMKGLQLYEGEQMIKKWTEKFKFRWTTPSKLQGLLGPWPSALCRCSKSNPIHMKKYLNIFCKSWMCGKKHRPLTPLSGPVWDAPAVFQDVRQQYKRQNSATTDDPPFKFLNTY